MLKQGSDKHRHGMLPEIRRKESDAQRRGWKIGPAPRPAGNGQQRAPPGDMGVQEPGIIQVLFEHQVEQRPAFAVVFGFQP